MGMFLWFMAMLYPNWLMIPPPPYLQLLTSNVQTAGRHELGLEGSGLWFSSELGSSGSLEGSERPTLVLPL